MSIGSQSTSGQLGRKAALSKPFGRSLVRKRSIAVDGRKTSIRLEDDFQNCLRETCREAGETPAQAAHTLARKCVGQNVSSTIRVFVLEHYTVVGKVIKKVRHQPF